MLNLLVYEEQIICDYAEKGHDYIKAYFNSETVRIDSGITDFSGYILTDESENAVPFSTPDPTESDRLRALENAMLAVMMGGAANV